MNPTGIDTSHLQGVVDWPTIQNDGYTFAYAKATEGNGFNDPMFVKNWSAIRAAGLLRGAYHFFHPAFDAAHQAAQFLAALKAANGTTTLNPGDLPPWLDLEWVKDAMPSPAVYVTGVQTWLNIVEQATGRTPGIYTAAAFWNPTTLSSGAFARYPLAVAEYGVAAPRLPAGWRNWTFWQTSGNGLAKGIACRVDLDAFNGTLIDLQTLAGIKPASAPPPVKPS